MTEPVVLHSRLIGAVLKGIFWGLLVYISILLLLCFVMLLTGRTIGMPFLAAALMLGLFQIGYLPLLILGIVWVVAFHKDLGRVFPDYPLGPLKAVLYMFIPIFNLYGLWRTFASISEYLRASGGEAGRLGDRANYWATFGYISLWVGGYLYYYAVGLTTGPDFGQGMSPWTLLIQVLLASCFVICYLNSIRFSQRSLALVAADGVAFDTRSVLTHMK